MAPKFPRLRLSLLRSPLQANNPSLSSLPPQNPNPISPFGTLSPPKPTPPSPSPFPRRTAPNNNPFLFSSRTLASASGASGIVVVGSAAGFDTAFKKVQDEKLNAIFYFTAVWCGPFGIPQRPPPGTRKAEGGPEQPCGVRRELRVHTRTRK